MIVEEIAARLYQEHGSPDISDPRSMCAEHEVSDTEPEFDDDMTCMVRTALKENNESPEWWRAKVWPSNLLPQARAAVVKAITNKSKRGVLQALPLHRKDVEATPSTRREQRDRWLQSDDVTQWRADRHDLFGCK